MNFSSLRKEINSKNISVKELINEFFLKIDSKDSDINSYICTTKENAIVQGSSLLNEVCLIVPGTLACI